MNTRAAAACSPPTPTPTRSVYDWGGQEERRAFDTYLWETPRSMCDAVLSTFALGGIVGSRAKPLLIRVEWIELMTTRRAPVLG